MVGVGGLGGLDLGELGSGSKRLGLRKLESGELGSEGLEGSSTSR